MNTENNTEFLRHLVDVVWSDSKESDEVPSTLHADNLINKAKETFKGDLAPTTSKKPVKALKTLCEGCSHNKPMEGSVYCENCRNEPK